MEGVGKRGPATTWGRTVGSREGPLMERVHDGLVESTEPAAPHDLHLANMATLIDQQSHHDRSLLSGAHRSIGINWLDTVSDSDVSTVGSSFHCQSEALTR